jgi:hypothetical protein
MPIDHRKAQVAAAWMLSIGVAGYAAGPTSVAGWTVLLALALTPPLAFMRLWRRQPAQSESIREVLR